MLDLQIFVSRLRLWYRSTHGYTQLLNHNYATYYKRVAGKGLRYGIGYITRTNEITTFRTIHSVFLLVLNPRSLIESWIILFINTRRQKSVFVIILKQIISDLIVTWLYCVAVSVMKLQISCNISRLKPLYWSGSIVYKFWNLRARNGDSPICVLQLV